MVVGAIVVRCPGSTVAAKAYMELGLSVAMFEKGAEQSDRARSGLVGGFHCVSLIAVISGYRTEVDG